MRFLRLITFALSLLIYSCTSLTIENLVEVDEKEDWLFIGGNSEKTNVSKSREDLKPPFKLYWRYDVDGGLSKNCLSVSDAILFANTLNGESYALDILSGKSLGRTSTIGKSSFSTPLIAGNNIIVTSSGNNRSKVFNYSLITGLVKWERHIGWVESSPVKIDEDFISSSMNGLLYRINIKTGNIIWTTRSFDKKKRYGSFYTSPTVLNNIIYAGNSDGNMYAFNLNDGTEKWKFETGNSVNCDASAFEDKIYFGSDDMNFYCTDTNGTLIWKNEMKTKFQSSSTFYRDLVIISGIDGNVYAMDRENGDIKWTFSTKGVITASPLLQNNKIFVGSYDKNFYCLDANDGRELWKYQCEGRIKTSAVIWKDFIFTASDERYIYCFSNREHQKSSSGRSSELEILK